MKLNKRFFMLLLIWWFTVHYFEDGHVIVEKIGYFPTYADCVFAFNNTRDNHENIIIESCEFRPDPKVKATPPLNERIDFSKWNI